MSLLRAAAEGRAAAVAPGPCCWLPSHVQVTVGQARGLRLKGGPGDAFAVLQLGRQKHRTAVATLRGAGAGAGAGGGPRWGEECALELPPAAPDETDAAALLLHLTVWQRALVGLDRFLGRAVVPLGPLLQAGRSHPDQWHKLHSKPGKKEKERGEVQLSIHFTRHSLTASMFDLSVKDKPRSPFGKLRDKMKGRRQYDLESASAIVPSSSGALEEGLGLGGKKAQGAGGLFFRHKLRKSSLTQSSTSLGSESSISSASSMVGMAALEVAAAPSPSRHGSLPADRSVRDFLPSPKLTHKRAFSDEVSQVSALPESRSVQSLKPQSEPISRSSLCINGSHVYCEEPSPRPAACPSSAAAPHSRPKKLAENFSPGPSAPEPPPWSSGSFQRPPQKDPPRFIPSPPILAAQEEDKLSVKTLALNKHRSRAKMDEGWQAEGKPIQVAAPMVFPADPGQGRPQEEAQKEEKRAKAGFFRRGSAKEDAGKRAAESAGPVAAVGGPEGEKSGSWFSLRDALGPSHRPSSQPGLLAASEASKDTCVCEDRGPAAFPGAGAPQPESAPPSMRACELAPAAGPPLEWGDPFDVFATSRLRPETQRETLPPLPPWDVASEGPADRDPAEEDASPLHVSAGLPLWWPSQPEGSPGAAPEDTWRGGERLGEPPWGTCVETGPRHPPLQGAGSPLGPCQEDAIPGASLTWKEAALAVAEAETAEPGGEATCHQAWSAGAPATFMGPELPLGQARESNASRAGSSEKHPRSSPTESTPGRPAVLPLGTSLTSEAETGEEASADVHSGGAAGREQATLQMPPAPGRQPLPGTGQLPEEARGVPSESWEQTGEGGQGAEAAPPKPPRKFAPLSLEEEAREAPGGARPRCEGQEGPGGEADGPGPAAGDSSTSRLIGAGGEGLGRAAEGLLLSAQAKELARQAGSGGDSELAAGAKGAEQSETCPGKPSPAGAGGEPCSALPSGLGSPQGPGPLPVAEDGGRGPRALPQEPEASPSLLFWTALEEQLLQSRGSPSPEPPRGLCRGAPDLEPGPEQGSGGVALAVPEEVDPVGSQSSWGPPALPACPQVSASGLLEPGGSSASDLELSSSWSDDKVVDFKRADFWQAARGEEGSGAPGNPFVLRASPQNNPFVERPPEAPPVPQGEDWSCRDLPAEAGPPQGLLPAAPFPHGSQPLAFSTPSLDEAGSSSEFDFPSPIVLPAPGEEGSAASSLRTARLALALPSTDAAAPSFSPLETQPADKVPEQQTTRPHPVKPMSTSRPVEKQRRSSLPLGQEKIQPKSTSSDDLATPILPLGKTDLKRDPSLPDGSARYLHLTHEELVQLLLKREAELSKKQEHIRELENYIDRLLVRIMEQSPTLLQIPLGVGTRAAK